jgi:hypothetical protein
VTLPLFITRRRTPFTCTACGTKLERVLPASWYYTLNGMTALMAEVAGLLILLQLLLGKWPWAALVAVGTLLVNLGVSAFLNARTRVEYANIEDARRDEPGRWYPQ